MNVGEWPVSKIDGGYRVEMPNGVTLDLVSVAGGEFMMGWNNPDDIYKDERPPHRVRLDGFNLGKYEVTQEQWLAVMGGKNPSSFQGGKLLDGKLPVETVSWNEAREFCQRLTAKTGVPFDLPTEAQWEYAARGGASPDGQIFAGGSLLAEVGWPGAGKAQPVGQRKPNAAGLYDMSGHIWQWTQDWYDGDFYMRGAANNPRNAKQFTKNRVLRGGSFDYAAPCGAVYYRYFNHPENPRHDTGFRIVSGGAFRGNL